MFYDLKWTSQSRTRNRYDSCFEKSHVFGFRNDFGVTVFVYIPWNKPWNICLKSSSRQSELGHLKNTSTSFETKAAVQKISELSPPLPWKSYANNKSFLQWIHTIWYRNIDKYLIDTIRAIFYHGTTVCKCYRIQQGLHTIVVDHYVVSEKKF